MFWRRRTSTDDKLQRPGKNLDGFPHICRRNAPIGLTLGRSVQVLQIEKCNAGKYSKGSPLFPGFWGSCEKIPESRYRIPRSRGNETYAPRGSRSNICENFLEELENLIMRDHSQVTRIRQVVSIEKSRSGKVVSFALTSSHKCAKRHPFYGVRL